MSPPAMKSNEKLQVFCNYNSYLPVCVLQLKLGSGGTVLWQLSSIVKIDANHVKRGNINGERGKNMPSAARFMRGPVTFVKLAMTFLNLDKNNYLIFGGVRSWAPI